ncbi:MULTISPECIES: thymidylate synthase [Bacillus cereus group]|nr:MULTISPECIES: thymidylate synthase [Bacillus cereus group]MCB5895361.1 thymidylate synthase [Bacillus cereus]MDX6043670.1 thymidylate synthase [Bacillus paranthracis]
MNQVDKVSVFRFVSLYFRTGYKKEDRKGTGTISVFGY